MVSLSFNPTRIRHPPVQSHKPISHVSSSFLKSIKIAFQFSLLISTSNKQPRETRQFRPDSASECLVSLPLQTETIDDEILDDPTAELSYLDPEIDPREHFRAGTGFLF